jgi:hypothetical protein
MNPVRIRRCQKQQRRKESEGVQLETLIHILMSYRHKKESSVLTLLVSRPLTVQRYLLRHWEEFLPTSIDCNTGLPAKRQNNGAKSNHDPSNLTWKTALP